MKRKLVLLMLLLMCAFTACSQNSSGVKDKADSETEESKDEEDKDSDEDEDEDKSSKKKNRKDKKKDESADEFKKLEGSWELCYYENYYGVPGDRIDDMEKSFYMSEDDCIIGTVEFYEEDGSWYADMSESHYESFSESLHVPVKIDNSPLYDSCENQKWHVVAENPRKGQTIFKATLIDDNYMIIYSEYSSEDDEYDYDNEWKSIDITSYYKEGSPELENKSELAYLQTVTVSDVADLIAAIDDNTRIILEPGDYDLSSYVGKADNPKAYISDRSLVIDGVSYMKIEVENGQTAELSIDDPYSAVINFADCEKITFDGLTCGHHVEPGTCGAPVLGMRNCYDVTIDNCHLYGCGSYGLEASDCSSIYFDNTEIYECTYGIVSGYRMYYMSFTGCDMHDNSEYTQIELYDSHSINFDDCRFTNNNVSAEYYNDGEFVHTDDESGYIYFTGCEFKGNSYGVFTNETDMVEITDCTFDDDVRGID